MMKTQIVLKYFLSKVKSKRVMSLRPERVQFQDVPQVTQQKVQKQYHTKLKSTENQIHHIQNWQNMSFDQLCRLPIPIRQKIILDIKKHKFNVTDEEIKQASKIASIEYQDINKLTNYDRKVYGLLSNKMSIEEGQVNKQGYMGQMQYDDPTEDHRLLETIRNFVTSMSNPQKLELVSQASFNKYLLGIKRDLMIKGLLIQPIPKDSQIEIVKILKYQHQFWVDLHHNRSKNGQRDNFIVIDKQIPNPNKSLLLQELYSNIQIKYIMRKRKSKDYEMCFCTKIQVLIKIDKNQHLVKVQWKGPSQKKKKLANQQLKEGIRNYLVIDFDRIYRGNPTLKPIFSF